MQADKPMPEIEFRERLEQTTSDVFKLLADRPVLVCLGACLNAAVASAQAQGLPLGTVKAMLTAMWDEKPERKPN